MIQSQNQADGDAINSRSQNEPAESQHIQKLHERAQYFDLKVEQVHKSCTLHTKIHVFRMLIID